MANRRGKKSADRLIIPQTHTHEVLKKTCARKPPAHIVLYVKEHENDKRSASTVWLLLLGI